MRIPTGCYNNVRYVKFDGDNIYTYKVENGEVNEQYTYDTYDNATYKGAPEAATYYGDVITNDGNFNNVPHFETADKQTINGARINIFKGFAEHGIYTFGMCGTSCVGCTTCNGCYNGNFTTNSCRSGCTTNCAEGCTNGCTSTCTTGCTTDYGGRYRDGVLVCKECNSECNSCTECTSCVENVARQYCTLATTCNGCTAGETVNLTHYEEWFNCKEECQNGLNGLVENAWGQANPLYIVVDESKCVQGVSCAENYSCVLFTFRNSCSIINYSCVNGNSVSR